jgi:hypothetical protein
MSCKPIRSFGAALLLNAALIMAGAALPSFGRSDGKPVTPGRAENRLRPSLRHTVVLDYEDFGSQVMSYGLIGYGWNQWKNEGHELPDDVAVRVVVYKGVSVTRVRRAYPVVKGRSDYRYVGYGRALRFLDRQIAELEGWKKGERDADSVKTWEDLLTTLKNTRAAIIWGLGRST